MNSTEKKDTYSQIDTLVKAFEEAQISPPEFWMTHLENRILDYPDNPEQPANQQHQRVLINRALRLVLSAANESFNARYALIDCCEEKIWISSIKQYIIPFIKENVSLWKSLH